MSATDERESRHAALMHEIRNHLAVARANIEAFLDGKFAPTPDRLSTVKQTLSELESLLEGLQGLPRSGEAQAKPRRINLCVILTGQFRAMEAAAANKRVTMSVTQCAHRAEECEHFFGDPVRIGQIIKNAAILDPASLQSRSRTFLKPAIGERPRLVRAARAMGWQSLSGSLKSWVVR